jgi:hypothetical protein
MSIISIGDTKITLDYTVGWFTLSLINAGLAQSKRLSGGFWFIVSLFLGPLATLMLLFRDGR